MARLSVEQWEQARAEYEVRGVSLGEVAKAFGVATSSVSRRARAEGWTQGKMQDLVERKVAAAKEMQAVETQMQELPLRFQLTMHEVVQERLRTEGAALNFARAVAMKGTAMTKTAESPAELELLSRAARNVMPQVDKGQHTTVNVQQHAQAQAAAAPLPSAPPAADTIVRAVLSGTLDGDEE